MKRLKVCLFLTTCLGLFSMTGISQTELQARFDLLIPRLTNLEQIEKIIGPPDARKKLSDWYGKLRKNASFYGYDSLCLEISSQNVKRNVYEFNFPASGLRLLIFDNPWNLYSVEVTNPEISVLNSLKVGDSLEKIQKTLGKGQWYTTDKDNFWTLGYAKKGIKFFFSEDKNDNKRPPKIAKDAAVLRLEVFDKSSTFAMCSESYFRSL